MKRNTTLARYVIMPIEDTRTIKEARAELRRWGKFWQRYTEFSSSGSLMAGFIQNQRSATKYHRRRVVKKGDARAQRCDGVERPYTADCSPTRLAVVLHEKEIFVPWSLQAIDDLIESMQDECKQALRICYIEEDRDRAKGIWLDRAESIVMYSI